MIKPDNLLELSLIAGGAERVAGIDECGRGAIGGPASVGVVVVDLAVLLDCIPEGVRDSKMLSSIKRRKLIPSIKSWAVSYAVEHSSSEIIDRIGINAALRDAAQRALARVGRVDCVILDGKFNWLSDDGLSLVTEEISKGLSWGTIMRIGADQTCISVAAASVLAKVAHDEEMVSLEEQYPGYGWLEHKGYLTEQHRAAIAKMGLSRAHRRTWKIS
jgi:ribonuclease HII